MLKNNVAPIPYPPAPLRHAVVSAGYFAIEQAKSYMKVIRTVPRDEVLTPVGVIERAGIDYSQLTPVERSVALEMAELAMRTEGWCPEEELEQQQSKRRRERRALRVVK